MDAAMIEFVERNNRDADPTNAADLSEIYKIGKKYAGIGGKRR